MGCFFFISTHEKKLILTPVRFSAGEVYCIMCKCCKKQIQLHHHVLSKSSYAMCMWRVIATQGCDVSFGSWEGFKLLIAM